MKSLLKSNWMKLLFVGVLLIIIYKSVDKIADVFSAAVAFINSLLPIIIGTGIALFTIPPVRATEKLVKKIPAKPIQKAARVVSVLVVYFLLFLILGCGIRYIVPVLYKNIEDIVLKLPIYAERLNAILEAAPFADNLNIDAFIENAIGYFDISRISTYLSFVTGVANSFLSFVVSVIISVYIILDKEKIYAFLKRLREVLKIGDGGSIFILYVHKIVALFRSYFTGLIIDSTIVGTVSAIVFFVFRIPYAVFLGLVVAIGNMIPFFGPIVAAVITYLFATIHLGPLNALGILAFQLVIGQIDGNVIQPKIIGSHVGISPLVVLVSVTVFGGLFGPLGMILGVPVCASAKLMLDDYMDNRKFDASSDYKKE